MDQWIEILGKNGLAIAALVAVGWFAYKKLWPIIEKRLADADAREKENMQRWEEQGKMFTATLERQREDDARRFEDQGKRFTDALRTLNVIAAETHKDQIKAQNELARSQSKIAEKLETLTHQLRNGNGK